MLCIVKIGFGEGSITGGNPLAHIGSSGVYRSQALGGTALATEYLLILHLRGTRYDGTLRG